MEDKNIFKNDNILNTLFENSNDNDILYKNDLFSPLYEEDEENKNKSNIELNRDKIIKNLSLEDYNSFPPKNDSYVFNINENYKEDQEKLLDDEIEHLINLHNINYLTFSPFGNNFIKNNNKIDEEQENKILDIIDFDYNNFEINNDLLYNISMGFIDINKLKIENVVSNDNYMNSLRKHIRYENKNLSSKSDISEYNKKNEEKSEISESDEYNTSMMNELEEFVNKNKKIDFYSEVIKQFSEEFKNFEKIESAEKNNFLEKWKKIFDKNKKLYKKHLTEKAEIMKQKEKEEKIKREIERKLEKERLEKLKKEQEFIQELEKIRMKGMKTIKSRNKSTINNKLITKKKYKTVDDERRGYIAKNKDYFFNDI